jgi:hypothetical protein
MARPKDPNSKRQIQARNKERLERERAEKLRLQNELEALKNAQTMPKNDNSNISTPTPDIDNGDKETRAEQLRNESAERFKKLQENDLFAQLARPTEEKPKSPTFTDDLPGGETFTANEGNIPQQVVTAEFREPTPQEAAQDEAHAPTLSAPQTEQTGDPEKVKIKMKPRWTADQVITGFDALQQFGLPLLYEAKMFTTEERLRIKNLVAQEHIHRKAKERTYTEEEHEALNLLMDFDSWKDSLPFTNDDKDSLREPLEALLQNANFELSPGWALVFSVGVIMFARTSPILLKMGQDYAQKVQNKALEKEAENEGKTA